MTVVHLNSDSPIVRGIKTVGIGKKGSRPLTNELTRSIVAELKTDTVPPASKGAFFCRPYLKRHNGRGNDYR